MNSLIVGSGPSAIDLKDADLSSIAKIAVNNAWLLRADFDYVVYPFDFPPDRRPPSTYAGLQVSNAHYMEAINSAGGMIFCGATMAFATGYWAVHTLGSKAVGFFASDMVYSGTKTHFYGEGTADPLRADVTLRNLEAKSARLFLWALTKGTLLVNCSEQPETRLVFPRLSLSGLSGHDGPVGPSFRPLIDRANEIFALEKAAPFDAKREEYWMLADTKEKIEYISLIDNAWAAMIPSIEGVVSSIPGRSSFMKKLRRLVFRSA